MIEMESLTREVQLLVPPTFECETQQIEYRKDPLTGSSCLINIKRAQRARQAEAVYEIPKEVTKATAEGCFFCPKSIEESTPRFPHDICRRGREYRNESTLFPNLFAFAEYHAVATLSHAHFLDLHQFSPEMIMDNMLVCRQWMQAVNHKNQSARWPVYIWNHMPPSGASMVHPHVQTLVREDATAMQKHLLKHSLEYFVREQRSFWDDLLEMERNLGDRWIGENGSVAIIASFAPRGFREIQFVFPDTSAFTDLTDEHIRDFAHALVEVLRGYKELGVGSFNLNFFSGPIGERTEYCPLSAKLISRPFPRGLYSSDTGPFERLQDEWVIEYLPEDVAAMIRRMLGS